MLSVSLPLLLLRLRLRNFTRLTVRLPSCLTEAFPHGLINRLQLARNQYRMRSAMQPSHRRRLPTSPR